MIPKTIHYVWLGGKEYPKLVEKCIESWKKYLPDYHFKLWNEDNIPLHIPYVKKALDKKYYAFASDYIRAYALFTEGGIYLDTDMEVIKILDPLLEYDYFLGYQSENSLNASIMGSKKESIVAKLIMDTFNTMEHFESIPNILKKIYKEKETLLNTEDYKIFSQEYFYPYNPYIEETKDIGLMYMDITPQTYTIHHWQKSWHLSFTDRVKRSLKKRGLL